MPVPSRSPRRSPRQSVRNKFSVVEAPSSADSEELRRIADRSGASHILVRDENRPTHLVAPRSAGRFAESLSHAAIEVEFPQVGARALDVYVGSEFVVVLGDDDETFVIPSETSLSNPSDARDLLESGAYQVYALDPIPGTPQPVPKHARTYMCENGHVVRRYPPPGNCPLCGTPLTR